MLEVVMLQNCVICDLVGFYQVDYTIVMCVWGCFVYFN